MPRQFLRTASRAYKPPIIGNPDGAKRTGLPGLPPGWQPFAVSDLVLDLDAWESKAVRAYDEKQDSSRQAAKWNSDTAKRMRRKISAFERERAWSEQQFEDVKHGNTRKGGGPAWRVTDGDMLMMAVGSGWVSKATVWRTRMQKMKGGEGQGEGEVKREASRGTERSHHRRIKANPQEAAPATRSGESSEPHVAIVSPKVAAAVAELAHHNGISMRFWDDSPTLLQWALHRQSSCTTNLDDSSEAAAFLDQLSKQTTLTGIRRLVSYAMQTTRGVEIVAQHVDDVVAVLNRAAERANATAHGVEMATWDGNTTTTTSDFIRNSLPFLNNLSLRLQKEGFSLSAPLCRLALVASALARQPHATLRYWAFGHANGYWTELLPQTVNSVLAAYVAPEMPPSPVEPNLLDGMQTGDGRQALFCLLLGLPYPSGVMSENDDLATSYGIRWQLSGESSERLVAYRLYVQLLAELGAFRTLLAEFASVYEQVVSLPMVDPATAPAAVSRSPTASSLLQDPPRSAASPASLSTSDLAAAPKTATAQNQPAPEDAPLQEPPTTALTPVAHLALSAQARLILSALRRAQSLGALQAFHFLPRDDEEDGLDFYDCVEADFVSIGRPDRGVDSAAVGHLRLLNSAKVETRISTKKHIDDAIADSARTDMNMDTGMGAGADVDDAEGRAAELFVATFHAHAAKSATTPMRARITDLQSALARLQGQ